MERNLNILLVSNNLDNYFDLYNELKEESDFSLEVVKDKKEVSFAMKQDLYDVIVCTDSIGEKECTQIYDKLQVCSKKHFIDFILLYSGKYNWIRHPEDTFPVEDVFSSNINPSSLVKLLKSKNSLRLRLHSHYKSSFEKLFDDVFSKGNSSKLYNECEKVEESFARKETNRNEFNLTAREIQILDLSAQGLTIKEIGGRLFISNRTVEKYRTQILKKIKSVNITESVAKAIKNGIIMV